MQSIVGNSDAARTTEQTGENTQMIAHAPDCTVKVDCIR